jgi:eukaryotic-like serine/threonine-protein kinase
VSIHDVHVLPSPNPSSSTSLICLAMEYVEGGSLADYIASTSAAGRIPPPSEVVQIFTSIARAINIAHQHNIVHGNLKPTNILLKQNSNTAGRMGTPLLTDFGTNTLLPNRNGHDIPFYLAPEQIKGAPAEERSDIYTLGVILYELYTGVLPFRGNRPVAVMMQHINALPTPPNLVNPALSPALTQVILRCLAKDPRDRYPDAASLVVALAEALHVAVPEDLHRSAVLLDRTTSFASSRGTLPPIPSFPSKRKRGSNPSACLITCAIC